MNHGGGAFPNRGVAWAAINKQNWSGLADGLADLKD